MKCLSSLSKKKGTCCKNVKYMFIFSTGEELYSCGVKKHYETIASYVSNERSVNVYLHDDKNKNKKTQMIENIINPVKPTYETVVQQIRSTYSSAYAIKDDTEDYQNAIDNFDNYSDQIINSSLSTKTLENIEIQIKALLEIIKEKTFMNERYDTLIKLNKEFIEKILTMVTFRLPYKNKGGCAICFNDINENTGGSLRCNHVFHHDCITPWCKRDICEFKTCPVCRSYFNIYKYKLIK